MTATPTPGRAGDARHPARRLTLVTGMVHTLAGLHALSAAGALVAPWPSRRAVPGPTTGAGR